MRPANGGAGQFAVGGLLKESETAHLEQHEIRGEVRFFAPIGGEGWQ
jgi:hypothetical protein